MIRLVFTFIFLVSCVFGEVSRPDAISSTPHISKVLYLSFEKTPKRVIKGEIFPVTIKTLSTVKNFIDIKYKISNYTGVRLLNKEPYRKKDSKYLHDTFYLLATSSKAKIPDFTAYLQTNTKIAYRQTTLRGKNLNVITLNPKENFSNIVADSFEILDYKTTSYDNQHNIVVFSAAAQNCNIASLKFKKVFKQGRESLNIDIFNSKITYYVVIDKRVENFDFTYFNLKKNKFVKINIPIVVIDDSVTTQSDLKPKDQSRERLKMAIAATITLVGFAFVIWRKKYIYLIFILIPLAYIGFKVIPAKDICVKKGSLIYLLPVKNGTIFEKTKARLTFQKEGSVKNFTKIKLKNEKIGWVKNEDICKN